MAIYVVHISGANNLRAADSNGTSDPYIKYRKGKDPWLKTHVVKKSLDPKYNLDGHDYNLTMNAAEKCKMLQFEVWDKDTFGKDFLGYAEISTDMIMSMYDGFSNEYSIHIALGKRKAKDKAKGTLVLVLSIHGLERLDYIKNVPEINWNKLSKTVYGDILCTPMDNARNVQMLQDGIFYMSMVPMYILQLVNYFKTNTNNPFKGLEIRGHIITRFWVDIFILVSKLEVCGGVESLYVEWHAEAESLSDILQLLAFHLKTFSTPKMSLEHITDAMHTLEKLETLICHLDVSQEEIPQAIDAILQHGTLRHLYLYDAKDKIPQLPDLLHAFDTLAFDLYDCNVFDDPGLLEGGHTVKKFKGNVSVAFAEKMVSLNIVEYVDFHFVDANSTNVELFISELGKNTSIRSLILRTESNDDIFGSSFAMDTIFSMQNMEYLFIDQIYDISYAHSKFCSTNIKYIHLPYDYPKNLVVEVMEHNTDLLYLGLDCNLDTELETNFEMHNSLRYMHGSEEAITKETEETPTTEEVYKQVCDYNIIFNPESFDSNIVLKNKIQI